MIRFYTARNRYDAYLLADRLKQAGIRAHVFNEHASSIVGDVPPDVAQPQVWLEREQDRERALLVLARHRGRRGAAGVAALRGLRRGVAGIVRPLLELRAGTPAFVAALADGPSWKASCLGVGLFYVRLAAGRGNVG